MHDNKRHIDTGRVETKNGYRAVTKADSSTMCVFRRQVLSAKIRNRTDNTKNIPVLAVFGNVRARATRPSVAFYLLVHADGAPKLHVARSYALDLTGRQACRNITQK